MTHPKLPALLASDPWLEPYASAFEQRLVHVDWMRSQHFDAEGALGSISQGHHSFGIHDDPDGQWVREWAPGAAEVSIVGDFNDWNPAAHCLERDEWGVWSLHMPPGTIPHGGRLKLRVNGQERLPAYIRRVVQEPSGAFIAEHWNPAQTHEFRNARPGRPDSLRIYEAHVGMAHEDGHVGSFAEFAEHILPRIAGLGYNAVQLMAIAEHPYYGSFGYHVSSFFAPSSRFGTPEELKQMVDAAHGMGLLVIMDIVHSHAVKNVNEGLNRFDGTDYQYFHQGARGDHSAWDSKLFDYGKHEVLRFLLSNVRYWLEEYRMDGYRFDGVTSMMYHHHGLGYSFTGYGDYVGGTVDEDAVAYLTLANEVAHALHPETLTVAEDVSGMPGLALPLSEGGIGFDYRLAMGVPDHWIKLLKEQKDEDWHLGGLYHELTNRRPREKSISYAESHDQALVGDKTIAFWLMDAKMYDGMSKFARDLAVDRGIALHKMIRLVTFATAGGGYLNFMGNEFGHPEWIDFPRPENNFSHHYARRQWSLVEQDHLHYSSLNRFDAAMIGLDTEFRLLSDPFLEPLAIHEDTRQLVFRRGPLVFAFNFHPTESFDGLRIPIPDPCDLRLVLNTDDPEFSGNGAVAKDAHYPWQDVPMYGRGQSVQIYLPARSALVLAPR